MKLDELINIIAKGTGKNVEDLKKEFDETLTKNKEAMKGWNEEAIIGFTMNSFQAQYRKMLTSKGQLYEGVFIGSHMQRRTRNQKAYDDIMDYYKKKPDDAITKKMVKISMDENGEQIVKPLFFSSQDDFVKKQDWQIKNEFEESGEGILTKNGKTYIGKEITPDGKEKTVFGFIQTEDNKFVKMELKLRKKNVDVDIPLFTIVKFKGFKLQSSTDEYIKLNDSGEFAPIVVRELEDNEVETFLNNLYKERFYTLDQIEEVAKKVSEEFNGFGITKAMVMEIPPIVTKTGSGLINITDETMPLLDEEDNPIMPIPCWTPADMRINFPERVQIYVIGVPRLGDENKKSISVCGLYVPKIFRNSIPEKESIETVSEDAKNW